MNPMNDLILNDPGGFIPGHVAYGAFLASIKMHVVVVYCASACLNLIAQIPHDYICFRPSAWIGYHTDKRNEDGTENPNTMRWERGSDWIVRGYRSC
jgi:hypothetical protein